MLPCSYHIFGKLYIMERTAKIDLLIQTILLVVGAIAGILIIKYFWGPEVFSSEHALKYELAADVENGYDDVVTMLCVKFETLLVKICGEVPFGYWMGAGCGLMVAMLINTIIGTDRISYYVRNIGIGCLTVSVALLITFLPLGILLLSVGVAIFFLYAFAVGFSGFWIILIIANLIRLFSERRVFNEKQN